jgi:UDP-glucuronate 4-epimerase
LNNSQHILVTGAAGFIGMHVSKRLLNEGYQVIGIDNLNAYYDIDLKKHRIEQLSESANFRFYQLDINDKQGFIELFENHPFQAVIHLAAQAGVRYSIENPQSYADSNLGGFINVLEACRHHRIQHLIYASSSSVYGANTKVPFSVEDPVNQPVSLYAASKRANELIAYSHSHLYQLPTTGLRFFTVYGPWGRPDMAYFSFTKNIMEGKPIKVFNNGKMERDFTYIDDIVEGVYRLLDHIPQGNDTTPPYALYNIGNNQPESLHDFISYLEQSIGKKAKKEYHPMQPGDVLKTYADIQPIEDAVGF